MKPLLSFLVSSGGIAVGTGVRALALWLIVVSLANQAGPGAVGRFSFALAVASPIFVFAELALRNIFVTLRDSPAFATYFTLRLGASLVASGIVMLVSAIPGGPDPAILAPMTLAKTCGTVLDIVLGSYQRRSMFARMALLLTVNGALIYTLFTATLLLTGSLSAAIVGWACASIIPLVIALPEVRAAEGGFLLSRKGTARLLRAGVPAGLGISLVSLIGYVPVLALGTLASAAAVGIFSALNYFSTMAHLIFSSQQQILLSRTSRSRALSPTAFRRSLRDGWLILGGSGALAGALIVLFGQDAARLIYGAEFEVHREPFFALGLAVFFAAIGYASTTALLTLNLYGVQVRIAAFSLVITLIVLLLIREDFGVASAAWLAAVGSGTRSIVGFVISRRKLGQSAD